MKHQIGWQRQYPRRMSARTFDNLFLISSRRETFFFLHFYFLFFSGWVPKACARNNNWCKARHLNSSIACRDLSIMALVPTRPFFFLVFKNICILLQSKWVSLPFTESEGEMSELSRELVACTVFGGKSRLRGERWCSDNEGRSDGGCVVLSDEMILFTTFYVYLLSHWYLLW